MKELIRTIVSNEKKLEKFCNDFFAKNVVDLKDVFAGIDVNKNGILSEFEVLIFLSRISKNY